MYSVCRRPCQTTPPTDSDRVDRLQGFSIRKQMQDAVSGSVLHQTAAHPVTRHCRPAGRCKAISAKAASSFWQTGRQAGVVRFTSNVCVPACLGKSWATSSRWMDMATNRKPGMWHLLTLSRQKPNALSETRGSILSILSDAHAFGAASPSASQRQRRPNH